MTTDKQAAANRENAQHSTGPRSLEGKRRVAQNALKHGLTAESVTLPGEDPQAYEAFKAQLHAELDPRSVLEWTLAEQVANKLWRLLRVPRIEAHVMRKAPERTQSLYEVIHGVSEFGDDGDDEGGEPSEFNSSWGFTCDWVSKGMDLLTRYEVALEGSVRRLLNLLREEQRRRFEAECYEIENAPT
jgi:hypothetical protein